MLAGLLGEERVARVARPDRVEDERLGQVVRLGHDVPGALVVDLLEPLVAIHQDLAGPDGEREREGQLVGERRGRGRRAAAGALARGAGGRHGALHSTVSVARRSCRTRSRSG